MKIAALVSGGVDSSVTVHLLKEEGLDPHLFYIKIGLEDEPGFVSCPSEEDIEIVTFLAHKYGLKLDIVSLQEEYWERVVDYTIQSVKNGLTPNPDVMCNKLIKFGSFDDKYGKDFEFISTGHYADVEREGGSLFLKTCKDKRKDQTYFLGQIDRHQLSKLRFPLAGLLKPEVRKIAVDAALPSATRPDSQGICFLGKINYSSFIKRYVGEKEGKIVELETGKILGTHRGFWFHTIGQRKGTGLSGGPWIVVKKNIPENVIYVSNGYDPLPVYRQDIYLTHFQFITDNPLGDDIFLQGEISFKIRHTPEFTRGFLSLEGGLVKIHSETSVHGVAPGQFGVIYDKEGNRCLGSGMISEENNA
ncbi:MAG: tRNA 2-thiouridine(34) synthase MnmA [Bacteroidetes bacterium]|nr:tRNA 2-thiouridine(34) synthase MnmA [Bacteroidota bacterium]